MATLRVTAEQLTIFPHPNADALELAQVGLYHAVVPKGAYRTGDYALYIPEQAILPEALIAELGLTGRLAGSKKNRVRAIRLRGELSQGIVFRPAAVREIDLAAAHAEGRDFAELLGIVKWVPEVPVHMSGQAVSAPDLLPWLDIEDIKRYPTVFESGEPVVVTEKIHGSACLTTVLVDAGTTWVTSKGLGDKRLALVEDEKNLYWRAVSGWNVTSAAIQLGRLTHASRVGIFAEIYGKGVQDLGYGANARGQGERPGYAVFDVAVDVKEHIRWLDPDELVELLGRIELRLPVVPRVYSGPYDEQAVLAMAHGMEQVSGRGEHIREGVVIRPAQGRYSSVLGGRAILKAVSEAYLTRQGGTEYE